VRVRVTPRGGRDAVIGVRAGDGVLLLRVAAPPVDGAANRACLSLVSAALGVRKAQVSLAGGETSREKRFVVSGLTPEERDTRLALLPSVGDGSP
jgi:uncharacterized protein YggU (UPF0235/DUF167 family)